MNALFKKGVLVAALAMTASSAMAATSLNIQVTGKILPSSCTPAFPSGGGIVDFGTMKVASLNSTGPTALPDIKTVPISITCEDATRVGVTFSDARSSSEPTESYAIPFVSTDFSNNPDYMFGLGMYNDKKIGAYALGIQIDRGTITNDTGDQLYAIFTTDNGSSWGVKSGDSYMQIKNDKSEIFSFTSESTGTARTPASETKINFNVGVAAIINPTNDLNITDEANLDGLTTVELVYL
ncbi:TPA: DUF1120 domain-containing protein [Salmonella enterica]|nr:DUF1120 domain-containing protein [Salmonella enterica]